jgi:hypothetical protein
VGLLQFVRQRLKGVAFTGQQDESAPIGGKTPGELASDARGRSGHKDGFNFHRLHPAQ